MKPSEIIREARNQLFERQWATGDLINSEGNVCSLGALGVAALGEPRVRTEGYSIFQGLRKSEFSDALASVHSAVNQTPWGEQRLLDDPHQPDVEAIYGFNDARATTFSDVVDVFDKAEKIAEARES